MSRGLTTITLACLSLLSCHCHVINWDFHKPNPAMYQYSFSSTIEVFFYRHNIYSQAFCSKWKFHRQYYFHQISWLCRIQGHFQDLKNEFVIFQVFRDEWVNPVILVHHRYLFYDQRITVCILNQLVKLLNSKTINIIAMLMVLKSTWL